MGKQKLSQQVTIYKQIAKDNTLSITYINIGITDETKHTV